MKIHVRALALAFMGILAAGDLGAQGPDLQEKQSVATRAFQDIKQRMEKLQVMLLDSDPERARTIEYGSRYIQEKRIQARMAEVGELLDDESWDDAVESSAQIVKDLDTLIDLLLKGDSRIEDILDEIKRLEGFKDRVGELAKQQQAEKDAAARAEALQKMKEQLEAAQKELAELLAEQKELREQTKAQGMAASPEAGADLADKEGELQKQAAAMAEKLAELENTASELEQPQPNEGEQPGEAKPGDSKPGDSKPGDSKPGDAKPGDSKPGDSKPGDSKPGESAKPPKGGSKSMQSASQSMQQAQKQLSENQAESSLEDQDAAVRKLEQAEQDLKEMLEEVQRKLQRLPLEQQAKDQEATRLETDKLAKDMEKSEAEKDGEQGETQTPGKNQVQQAVPKQKSAAGSLKEYKPGKAKQEQQDAKESLEEAQRKLEEALAQLRQQLQDEVLRSLEERFAEMLIKQKKVSAVTKIAERQKAESLTASGALPAALVKRCNSLAGSETDLANQAHDALKLLEEDGTTAVFPEFIKEIKEDLLAVGSRLQGYHTGMATQGMQAEIEDMLEVLIDALRQQIEQRDANGGGC